jgi:hypothetical protein
MDQLTYASSIPAEPHHSVHEEVEEHEALVDSDLAFTASSMLAELEIR